MGIRLSPRVVRQAVKYRNCLARFVGPERADLIALNNTILQKILPRLEHDAPEDEDAVRRHAGVAGLLQKLSETPSEVGDEAIRPPEAKALLKGMYDEADRLPDKRYRFWR
jgi:hypothetical protein